MYLLSMISLPKMVLHQIHKLIASLFWGKMGGTKGKHWVKWDDLSLLVEEGGLGFQSLFDSFKAFLAKLWWRFKTNVNSLWNKYCKKAHPMLVGCKGGSIV